MTRETIDTRMGQLRDEMAKANDELGKLRPRVQFLEAILLRIDGALTFGQELLDAPEPEPIPRSPQPRTDAEFAPSWHAPVAP